MASPHLHLMLRFVIVPVGVCPLFGGGGAGGDLCCVEQLFLIQNQPSNNLFFLQRAFG